MNTIIPEYDNKSSEALGNAREAQNSHNVITDALFSGTKNILLTGKSSNDKAKLLYTITNEIEFSHRLIFLKGKELSISNDLTKSNTHPSQSVDKNNCDSDFNLYLELVIESIKLDDKLIVVIEDADSLPIKKLLDLLNISTDCANDYRTAQFLMTSMPEFPKILQTEVCFEAECFTHFSINKPNKDINIASPSAKVVKTESYTGEFENDQNEFEAFSNIDKPNKDINIASPSAKVVKTESYTGEFENDQNEFEIFSNDVKENLQDFDKSIEWDSELIKRYQLEKILRNINTRSINSIHKYMIYDALGELDFNPQSIQPSKAIQPSKCFSHDNSIINSSAKASNNYSGFIKYDNIIKEPHTSKRKSNDYSQIINTPLNSYINSAPELENENKPTQSIRNTLTSSQGLGLNTIVSLFVVSLVLIVSYQIQSGELEQKNTSEVLDTMSDNSIELLDKISLINLNKSMKFKEETNIKDTTPITAKKVEKSKNSVVSMPIEQSPNTSNQVSENTTPIATAKVEKSKNSVVSMPIEQSPNTSNQSSEVNKLLLVAAKQFEANKLTAPSGDNALETYQYILFVNPNHEAALNGIKKIHERYVTWANYYLQNNDNTQAEHFFNKAQTINSNNKSNSRALENLNNAGNSHSDNSHHLLLVGNKSRKIQVFLNRANEKMMKVDAEIMSNERNFETFQDTQSTYEKILKEYPNTEAAQIGLLKIKNYYLDWAQLEFQNKNYKTSKFLYKQARSIHPNDTYRTYDTNIVQHIKNKIRQNIKKIKMARYKKYYAEHQKNNMTSYKKY